MDIKLLVWRERKLEQWSPQAKHAFPLPRQIIQDEIFPALAVTSPDLKQTAYSLQEYLDRLIRPHPQLAAVSVTKHRTHFDIDGACIELADIYINGALLRTLCVESSEPEQVLEICTRLYLDDYENTNYLLEIKRVIGMAPLPQGTFYRAC